MSSDTFIPTPELRQFLDLKEQISACRYCQEGFEPRPIVFGNLDAKIMQISQAPSCTAHNTGKPFDDASDRRLRS